MITLSYPVKPKKQKVPFVLSENQQLLLAPLGDIHYGVKHWPERKFRKHIDWCMERGATFIGVGEYLDFTSFSQRQIMSALREQTQQKLDDMVNQDVERLADILKPTMGHWIGLIEGDHRWTDQRGQSIDQKLCEALGAPFLGTASHITLKYPGVPKGHDEAYCKVYVHHGIGSSRTSGGHLNMLDKQVPTIDADIYLMGHTHSKATAANDRIWITPDGITTHRTILEARTGAWLKGYEGQGPLDVSEPAISSRGSYVEQAAYQPSAMGGLCIGIGYKQVQGSKYYRPSIHYSV